MTARVEAAVLVETGAALRIMDLKLPALGPGQVLVDVAYSGVCRSQINEVRGLKGPDPHLPHTLGHEGSGIVAEIGDGVTKVGPGDHVVLSWIKGEGAEVPSTVYQCDEGPVNSGAISTFMRRAVVSENRLIPIPPEMPLREAALLGCAVPTGGGIVRNTAKLGRGQSVAVFGIGGVGASAVAVAAMAGATPIIAVDVIEAKLRQAETLGATHTVNAASRDPLEAVLEITDGRGVDLSIEVSGRPAVMETAFGAARDGGGLCVVAGNPAPGERIAIDPYDLIRGKRLLGSWGGDTVPDRDIPEYAAEFLSGKLLLTKMDMRDYPLADIDKALEDLEAGRVGRALVDMAAEPERGLKRA